MTTATEFSGVNRGENAGRYCWRVAGTFCEGKVEGFFAAGLMSCALCDFYKLVQETERGQIARELHDQLGQELTAVKLNLETVAQSVQDEPARQRVEESIAIVGELMAETRNLALELRPPVLDDLGLTAALRWYTERQAERGGIQTSFSGPDFAERPPKSVESACFRIGQEAITNVLRHANAQRLDVRLTTDDGELLLTVQDDGVGFEVAADEDTSDRESMGMLGMQERASLVGGTLSIESEVGEGTTVRARFPLRTPQ